MTQTDLEINCITVNHSRGPKIRVKNKPNQVYQVSENWNQVWPDTDDLDIIFKTFNDLLDRFCKQEVKLLIVCNPPPRILISFWNKSLAFYRNKYKIDVKVLIYDGDSALYTLP